MDSAIIVSQVGDNSFDLPEANVLIQVRWLHGMNFFFCISKTKASVEVNIFFPSLLDFFARWFKKAGSSVFLFSPQFFFVFKRHKGGLSISHILTPVMVTERTRNPKFLTFLVVFLNRKLSDWVEFFERRKVSLVIYKRRK